MSTERPMIAHVVFGFHTGGLENGIVNLINRLPIDAFRHAVVALTSCAPEFCRRVVRDDVDFIELRKPPGHAWSVYPGLYRLFRQLAPAIVHTRNLAALEATVPARAAGVPVRIHGEHGWDTSDPAGRSRKYRIVRRLYRPFVSHYVALSGHLEHYLRDAVGVAGTRVSRICNGVDSARFSPSGSGRRRLPGSPFDASHHLVIGTVGRLQAIKDQITLARGFARLCHRDSPVASEARLMIVGDGPLRAELDAEIARLGIGDRVWLAGERADVPDVMRAMDVFVLPSRAEGISNTVLEAMASGLPVVATAVGGNPELVEHGRTGLLVPPSDAQALCDALAHYLACPERRHRHGSAGRRRVEAEFSIERMVADYESLYRDALERASR
jgi:sugar transferase (PEP-CTERM/EpsH1 system associated)